MIIFQIHYHHVLHPVYSAWFMNMLVACAESMEALIDRVFETEHIKLQSGCIPTSDPLLKIESGATKEYMEDWKSHSANPMPDCDWYKITAKTGHASNDWVCFVPDYGCGIVKVTQDRSYPKKPDLHGGQTDIICKNNDGFQVVNEALGRYLEHLKPKDDD